MQVIAEEKLQAYLAELTELAHRYGLGITGDAQLFVLEDGDEDRVFSINDESRLTFA
jgi:hypothetical protein